MSSDVAQHLARSLWIAALMALALVLPGCGASKAPRAVAYVQGRGVSRLALTHWITVKRVELESAGSGTAPSRAEVQQKALEFLITADWLEGESAADGVEVSASEVSTSYRHLVDSRAGPAFVAGMKRRGISEADELQVLRLGALAQKLRERVALDSHSLGEKRVGEAVAAFVAAYRQRWKQRTTCMPGYVIAECRNGPPL